MKISACLIIRDESRTLERCLASIRPHVDEICVLDTGSVDDSPVIAKRFADKWELFSGCNDENGLIADFSAARNRNLAMASHEALLWLDGDDELQGGEHLRRLVSEAPGSCWSYLAEYEYDHDAAGRPVTMQWRERMVAPAQGFEWRGPVHEGLLGRAGTVPTTVMTQAIRVVHHRRKSNKPTDPGRNLRILENWFEKNGEADARLMHYYGAELLVNRRIGEAMYWFRRHVQMAPWSDERCLSLLGMARVYLAIGDYTEAARWALDATATKSWPEPWWLLGQAYCSLAEQRGVGNSDYNVRRGLHALEQGFRLDSDQSRTLLMNDPTARHEAHAWLSAAYAKLGRIDEAIASVEKGLAGKPEHDVMRENHSTWRTARARERGAAAAAELVELGAMPPEGQVIIRATMLGEFKAELTAPKQLERPKLPEGKLDIVFFLGHQLEAWTPRTLEANGMGGSETMAWEMSKRLVALGHAVRVYAHCDAQHPEGNYDGVEWFDERRYAHLSCDLLICSRRADAAVNPTVRAVARVLWVHDVHCGNTLTPHVAVKLDMIWCLSQWHRSAFLECYPWLAKQKVEVTRNGIDPKRFKATDVVRNPHRAIYSSSPDRGLAAAVAAWPDVRSRIPDAELHCFYGFENWDRTLELMGDHPNENCNRAARDALKRAIADTPGIVMRGRVNGAELAREMLTASVWCYPTWFSETSCITAMEAQAAGLVCVCPPVAALSETVLQRIWVEGDLPKAMHQASGMALSGHFESRERAKRVAHGFDLSLDALAESWQARLNKLVTDARANVVPAFSEVQP